ncbi:MAG: thioredoxin-disulfide reductase [Christensenellales bacterium]
MEYDVIIIGGGPAGLTAAIYTTRGGLKTAIIEKQSAGGQISLSGEVENYPAVEKTSGFELAMKMMTQAESFGAEFIYDDVLSVDYDEKTISLASGTQLKSKTIIVATGAKPRILGLDGEKRLTGQGVSYCATCDGAFFKGKTVAVTGGGNTAVEDALYLKNFAKKVYLIHRRDSLRAEKALQNALFNSDIEILWNKAVNDINGENKVESVTLTDTKNGEKIDLTVDGLFIAIGQVPQTSLCANLTLDSQGYVITKEDMSTDFKGVYVAGDLRQKPLRQVVTACSDGAIAAASAIKYISEN